MIDTALHEPVFEVFPAGRALRSLIPVCLALENAERSLYQNKAAEWDFSKGSPFPTG